MGRTIHEYKITMKYLFTLVIFNIILNPQIQMSTNMSIVVKPRNLVSSKLKFHSNRYKHKHCHVFNGVTGIEHLLEMLQDRRRRLEELWDQRRIRLEQSLQLYQLDSEVNKVGHGLYIHGCKFSGICLRFRFLRTKNPYFTIRLY